jgi:hypothetical protein
MKKLMVWGAFGVVLGIAGGTLLGIRLTEWYFESPGAPLTCGPQIDRALHDLLQGQAIGAVAGLAFFFVLGAVWSSRHRPAHEAPSVKTT